MAYTDKDKTKEGDLVAIHKEAVERFEVIMTRERDQRALAVEDAKFAHTPDGQWDDDATEKRQGRPRYTINRVAGAIDQLVGDRRQTETGIKVRPVGNGADIELAKIYNGLIRNIEGLSKAENAYDLAYDELVTGGYGGWRVLTEYSDDDPFVQDIKIHTIDSASTSLFFGHATAYDKRDAKFAFLTTMMPIADYKAAYPDEPEISFKQEEFSRGLSSSWYVNETVRLAEYWVKVPVTRNVGLLSDGMIIDVDDEKDVLDELLLEGLTVQKLMPVKSHKVVMYKMNGSKILGKPSEWAGKYIPLIPAFGKVARIEGKEYVRGLVRNAKDPNRIYNYTVSSEIETTALTPKDPYWMTVEQAKGHEAQLRTFNTKNSPFMLYNSDAAAPGAPQRTGAPSVQTAMINQRQNATLDIYATTGIEPASLGNSPELKSGKAIIAQQKMGDRGSFVYADNLNKSIVYTGEILVDLIPRIMDTNRVVRILNIDGTSEEVKIGYKGLAKFNKTIDDRQTGKQEIVHDLSRGKYDVIVTTGPLQASQRQESAQQLIDLTASNPAFAAIATDLIAKNLDILEADELTKRVRMQMIQQGLIQPTEEETEEMGLNQPKEPTESEKALLENVQMQTEKMMAEIVESDAKTAKLLSQINKENMDAMKTMLENFTAQQEIGIAVSASDNDRRIKQGDIIAESQNSVDEGPNSEQAAEIAQMMEQSPQQ
jgi:hypothetical protein